MPKRRPGCSDLLDRKTPYAFDTIAGWAGPRTSMKMGGEDRVVPALFALLRALCGLALACAALTLAGGAAFAQRGVFQYRWNSPPPADAITPGDIRIALLWTGHLQSVYRGELDAAVLKAASLAEIEGPSAHRQAAGRADGRTR